MDKTDLNTLGTEQNGRQLADDIFYYISIKENLCISIRISQKFVPNATINIMSTFPDSKVHGANTGPTWVLSAPDGPHVGPMNLAIRVGSGNGLVLNRQQAITWSG